VDGYFWVVGGTGTQAALEAFVNAKGELTGDQHAGNLFFNPSLAQALGTDIAAPYVGGFAVLPGDVKTPEIEEYLASADETWTTLASGITGGEPGAPSAAASFGFMYGYYSAGVALAQALEETGGDPAPDVLQPALAELTLDLPYGDISLDENRSGIVDVGLSQLVEEDGEIVQKAVGDHPAGRPDLRRHLQHGHACPRRDFPPCEEADLPWVGKRPPVENGVPQEKWHNGSQGPTAETAMAASTSTPSGGAPVVALRSVDSGVRPVCWPWAASIWTSPGASD
jgi:branched-chain amino acid transport system substrate-binding protein